MKNFAFHNKCLKNPTAKLSALCNSRANTAFVLSWYSLSFMWEAASKTQAGKFFLCIHYLLQRSTATYKNLKELGLEIQTNLFR
jgi:hypothetical protein